MAYSSYWRGWLKSIQIFYFCFAAPSFGATKWWAPPLLRGEILLRKISKYNLVELLQSLVLTMEKLDLLHRGGADGQGTSERGQIGGFQV
jgi:hypothetical protein